MLCIPLARADQCLHAFLWYQTFLRDMNQCLELAQPDEAEGERIVLKLFQDLRLAPHHGKGDADAAGALVSRFLGNAVLDSVRYR